MRRLRAPLSALLLAAMLAGVPSLALAAAPAPTESYATLLKQIAAKAGSPDRVIAATIDKTHHHIRVTLANQSRPLVSYPVAQDKVLVDTLLHHHIKVIYAKKPAVHHTLRYVAAGVVVVLLLIGGGVWFYTRGRQEGDAGSDSQSDSPAAPAQ